LTGVHLYWLAGDFFDLVLVTATPLVSAPVLDHAACGWSHHAGYMRLHLSTTVNSIHAKPQALP
jgi:hypothetical protein